MTYSYIAAIAVPLALSLIGWQLEAHARRVSRDSPPDKTEFHPAPWVYLVILVFAVISGTFIY